MVQIDNSDELCCESVIVTMKEYVDGDPNKQYRNLRDEIWKTDPRKTC